MRSSVITSLLVLLYMSGCSQDDHHDYHNPRKIPIEGRRWYMLNDPITTGVAQLFNGVAKEKINTGWGKILDHYDAWYPLLPGEEMTIDSIEMFDWEGTNEDHPMTIYAVLDNWQRIPIAVFTGARYNAWDGPDPKSPDIFALKKPVSHIRYLVIDSWDVFPGEIELYGSYTAPAPAIPQTRHTTALRNYFGVNAFEWDFLGQQPMDLDPVKTAAIKNFTGVRHYMDWDKLEPQEGVYTFAPTQNGTWNYDTVYAWCKANHIEVLACLKTIPPWLLQTYPKNEQDNENVPMRYGKDPSDPMSYAEQARVAFQYAARYGSNRNVDRKLLKVGQWNTVRTGLDYVHYIECDNERDKWWKGRHAYQTGREYAANLSAFYDGHKGKLGPGAGVKNADPSMKVVMAGLAEPDPGYLEAIIDWSKEFRGYKKDGTVDLPFDVINYHFYSSDMDYDYSKKETTGIAPEVSKAAMMADSFVRTAHRFANDLPVWVTEAGYDINQKSTQKAIPIKGKTAMETQGDWLLRTSLLYSRTGIDRVFYYELDDDQPNGEGRFATSGLVNRDRSSRPAADYFSQVCRMFGDYAFDSTLNTDPIVDRYRNTQAKGDGPLMYMIVIPDQKGRTGNYNLKLGSGDTAYIYQPRAGSKEMELTKKNTTNGIVEIQATETPVFVTSRLIPVK